MNGYGQPVEMQAALQQAMADYEKVQRRQEALQRAASSGSGYQLLGAALGGLAANKFGIDPAEAQKRLINEQFKYEQAQQAAIAQKQAQIEAQKQQQAEQEARKKYEALVPVFGEQGAYAVAYGYAKPSDVKADKTSAMQNAEAMGLKPGTAQYNAYIQQASGKPVTNVNVNSGTKYGKIPEGYVLKETEQGAQMVPIKGSPAEREAQQAKTKAASRGFTAAFENDNINNVIDQVIENADSMTTGAGGALLGAIPGTSARDLQENLKTIEADAAFSSLQDMRDNSPTGGALGQVSERELGLLSSARAALSASQSPEQFKQNLKRYKAVRNNAFKSVAKAYESDYGQPAPWLKEKEEEKSNLSNISDEQLLQMLQGGQ